MNDGALALKGAHTFNTIPSKRLTDAGAQLVSKSNSKMSVYLNHFTRGLLLALTVTAQAFAWTATDEYASTGLTVDTNDKADVIAFYEDIYLSSLGMDNNIGWTGNIAAKNPGTTSQSHKIAMQQRINYYRAMVGVPAIVIVAEEESLIAQEAAYLVSVNKRVSHYPTSDWKEWTQLRADACQSSLLAGGNYGTRVIDSYIGDLGSGNKAVGHRRILMHPYRYILGAGDIPPPTGEKTYVQANAIYIGGERNFDVEYPTICWPNAGYTPKELLPVRWSYTTEDGDYSEATLTMRKNGKIVAATIIDRTGWAGTGLTWEPEGIPGPYSDAVMTNEDDTYTITISNIKDSPQSTVKYTVIATRVVPETAPEPIAPAITQEPVGARKYEGKLVTLTTAATGTEVTVRWEHNGQVVANGMSYTFKLATATAGKYQAVATSPYGTAYSKTVTVAIKPPFVDTAIKTQPKSVTQLRNKNFTLAVTATGTNLKYQWYRNGEAIPKATLPSYTTVTNLTTAGKYHVVVTGSKGTIKSNTVTVTQVKPATIGLKSAYSELTLHEETGEEIGYVSLTTKLKAATLTIVKTGGAFGNRTETITLSLKANLSKLEVNGTGKDAAGNTWKVNISKKVCTITAYNSYGTRIHKTNI